MRYEEKKTEQQALMQKQLDTRQKYTKAHKYEDEMQM